MALENDDTNESKIIIQMKATEVNDVFMELVESKRQCMLCGLSVTAIELTQHLERGHTSALLELRRQKRKQITCLTETTTAKRFKDQVLIQNNTDATTRGVINWLNDKQLPLSTIDSMAFKKYIKLINRQYTLPASSFLAARKIPLMKKLTLHSSTKALTLSKCPKPTPNHGEAVIKILRVHLSQNEVEALKAKQTKVDSFGTECVGVVEALDEQASPELVSQWVGKRVLIDSQQPCFICVQCQRNEQCENMRRVRGALGEYLTIPLVLVHAIPDAVATPAALMAYPAAFAIEACDNLLQMRLPENQDGKIGVAIVGDVAAGAIAADILAKDDRYDITIFGWNLSRVHIIEEYYKTVFLSNSHATLPWMKANFNIVVECTGMEQGLEAAYELVQPLGYVLYGERVIESEQVKGVAPLLNPNLIVVNEVRMVAVGKTNLDRALEYCKQKADSSDMNARSIALDRLGGNVGDLESLLTMDFDRALDEHLQCQVCINHPDPVLNTAE